MPTVLITTTSLALNMGAPSLDDGRMLGLRSTCSLECRRSPLPNTETIEQGKRLTVKHYACIIISFRNSDGLRRYVRISSRNSRWDRDGSGLRPAERDEVERVRPRLLAHREITRRNAGRIA